jgi:hypothetical protein
VDCLRPLANVLDLLSKHLLVKFEEPKRESFDRLVSMGCFSGTSFSLTAYFLVCRILQNVMAGYFVPVFFYWFAHSASDTTGKKNLVLLVDRRLVLNARVMMRYAPPFALGNLAFQKQED